MRDANSVITTAVNGHTAELAREYEISEPRMFQLLGKDCSYPKAKRLIRAIGNVLRRAGDMNGVRLIKADMDALFDEILGDESEVTTARLNADAFEAVQDFLVGKPLPECRKALMKLAADAGAKVAEIDKELATPNATRQQVKPIVEAHKNGRPKQ